MTSEEPSSPEAESPYQSPRTVSDGRDESSEASKTPWLINCPSLKLLWECIAVGVLISVGPQYEEVLALVRGSWVALTTIVPVTLFGVMTGLGLALLVNHASREKFPKLQPGHWRLIVVIFGIVRFLLSIFVFDLSPYELRPVEESEVFWVELFTYTPEAIQFSLITIFYILILRTTQETGVWKWYAWVATIVFGVTAVGKILLVTPIIDIYGPEQSIYTPQGYTFLGLAAVATYGPYLIGVLMTLGVILDLAKNVPRDVYHYLGIVLVAIQPGVQQWMDYLAYHYYFSPLS